MIDWSPIIILIIRLHRYLFLLSSKLRKLFCYVHNLVKISTYRDKVIPKYYMILFPSVLCFVCHCLLDQLFQLMEIFDLHLLVGFLNQLCWEMSKELP